MTHHVKWVVLSLATIVVGLTGCGGTTGGVSSAASQVAQLSGSPPPPALGSRAGPLEMLETPATQEFLKFNVGEPLRIRYDSNSGRYEVRASNRDWARLVDDPQSGSGLALFADQSDLNGTILFGSATQPGGVPSTGTAQYNGEANVPALSGWGYSDRAPVGGHVYFNFDFGNGTLAGQIRPTLACDCEPIVFPTLDFTQTIFGKGNVSFSGKFDSTVSGKNVLSGFFTGPNVQELIGKWTFPFLFCGFPKEAAGVWIAKRD